MTRTSCVNHRGVLSSCVGKMGKVSKVSCSACRRDRAKCVVSSESTFCSRCLEKGRCCDLHLAESEWEKMELEHTQLKAQLKEIEEQESVLLPRKLRLHHQLSVLSKKEGEAIKRELAVIKDQEDLEQEATCVESPLSLEDFFSSEALASLEPLSPSILASAGFVGGNSAVSCLSQG